MFGFRNVLHRIGLLPVLLLLSIIICFLAWGKCAAPWNVACFENGGWGDHKFHYQGWISYLRSSSYLPPYIYSFTWPEASSVMFTDSIPLASIIFKPITLLFGFGNWQFFSLLSILNSFLVAWCVVQIARALRWKYSTGLVMGIILLTSNISWTRLYYSHEALQYHGILILALTLLIKRYRNILVWCLLMSISIGLHSYYLPMILACSVCLYTSSKSNRIAFLSCSILSILLSMYLYGFLPSSLSINSDVWGANMLSLIDPQQHSAIFGALKKREPFETEGYSYLGVGILIALVVSLIARSIQPDAAEKSVFPRSWWLIAWVLYVFALGHTWNIADTPITPYKTLYGIPGVRQIYEVFRSSGRFAWPLYYSIVIWAMHSINRLKSGNLVLFIVLSLQLLDSNLRVIVRQGHEYGRRALDANLPGTWAMSNPFLASQISGASLFLVGNISNKNVLPPPYTPQQLNPMIKSNWGGEGITRLPRVGSSISPLETFTTRYRNQAPSGKMTSDLDDGYAIVLTDNLEEISLLRTTFGSNLTQLSKSMYRVSVVLP